MTYAPLLHNMSCPPKTVIQHHPARALRLTRGLVFCWPPEVSADARHVLSVLDSRPWHGTARRAEAELRRRIDRHAQALPYPPAALVSRRCREGDGSCPDLLTICTILSKSSAHVYLRDKEPNLSRLGGDKPLALQLPLSWSQEDRDGHRLPRS